MTIQECIDTVDRLVINQYEDRDKIAWLNEVDAKINEEVIKTHETNEEMEEFEEYGVDVDMSKELLVPSPYSELYLHYLIAKIDYFNGELGKYNNAAAMYNAKLSEYKAWYTRTNMPLQKNCIRRG